MTSTPHGSSKIGIIGQGSVGTAISEGLERAGYEVRTTGRDPRLVRDVAEWGDLIILAVPYSQRRNAIDTIGKENLAEKTLVDVTNALDDKYDFAGSTKHSGAEEVQDWVGKDCCVVKAFNTTFARTMDTGQAQGEPLTLFCAGDDPEAKEEVYALGKGIGFDPVDAGDLRNARWLEPMGYLNMQVAKANKPFGDEVGFRYMHPGMAHHPRPNPKAKGRTERRSVTERTTRGGSKTKARRTASTTARSTKKSAKKAGTTRRRSF
jgi:predicted dinucleotide-binding enzyme